MIGGGAGSGGLVIRAELRDRVIERVEIASARPLSLAAHFTGRPIAVVRNAVASLHAVCGCSHAAAVSMAASCARGEAVSRAERLTWLRQLGAERIVEHLRGLSVEVHEENRLKPLRQGLSAAADVVRDGLPLSERTGAIRCALDLFERPSRDWQAVDDRLTADDDAAIVMALQTNAAFVRRPALPGRSPETGAAARYGWTAATPGATRAARLIEIADGLDHFGDGDADLLSAGRLSDGAGFAAVESPRGRLVYRLELDSAGSLKAAQVVAPTEWNFHGAGPVVRALKGRKVDGDPVAEIGVHAAGFAPCVGVTVAIREAAHA